MGFGAEDLPKLQDSGWQRGNSRTALAKSAHSAVALGLIVIFAGSAAAGTGNHAAPCVIGHRFEPGPIVNGHNRQPTPAEVEARTQQLRAWNTAGAGSCLATPSSSETHMKKSRGMGVLAQNDDHPGIATAPASHPDRLRPSNGAMNRTVFPYERKY
jgi:hypothetical protein